MLESLQLFNSKVTVQNYNNDFLILKPELISETRHIGKAIFQKGFDFIDEVIATELEICLKLNSSFEISKINRLKDIEQQERSQYDTYLLPIFFKDHDDWGEVQSSTGLSKNAIISTLVTTDFSIAMFGFLPGFIYLDGLDPLLHVPRKTVPSKYVKANSMAIGGKYLGLYALDSPGGWHVIGQMPIPILQIPDLPPVTLNPGDKIRLRSIEASEYKYLLNQPISLKEYNAQFRNN